MKKWSIFQLLWLSLIIGPVVISGCLEDIDSAQSRLDEIDQLSIQRYLEDNNLTSEYIADATGIYYRPVVENTNGENIEPGEAVLLYYDVLFLDNDTLHSWHETDGDPVPVSVGNFTMLPLGLEAGLFAMREGEKYSFIFPSRLAFGSFSTTNLPANSVLRYEVEVVAVHSPSEQADYESLLISNYIEDQGFSDTVAYESGLFYKQLEDSIGSPVGIDSFVYVTYTGRYRDSTIFDQSSSSSPFGFTLGRGQVIPGWDQGIDSMHVNERGILYVPSHLGYSNDELRTRSVIPNYMIDFIEDRSGNNYVPSFEILIFDVRVDSVRSN